MTTQEPSAKAKTRELIQLKDIIDRLEILEDHQTDLENRVQDIENELERNGT